MNMTLTQKQAPDGMASVSGFKLIIGIFFAILGVLLTLDNLDLIDADRYLAYWPLVLIAIGIFSFGTPGTGFLARSSSALARSPALQHGEFDFSIFDLWPVVLIVAGIGIVAHAFGFRLPSLSKQSDRPSGHSRRPQNQDRLARLCRRPDHRVHGRM